jgi:hypothetical protein
MKSADIMDPENTRIFDKLENGETSKDYAHMSCVLQKRVFQELRKGALLIFSGMAVPEAMPVMSSSYHAHCLQTLRKAGRQFNYRPINVGGMSQTQLARMTCAD